MFTFILAMIFLIFAIIHIYRKEKKGEKSILKNMLLGMAYVDTSKLNANYENKNIKNKSNKQNKKIRRKLYLHTAIKDFHNFIK